MKKKVLRIVPLALIVGLLVAIPASTQVFSDLDKEKEAVNLPLLILVNRMELTDKQMEAIHGILTDLLGDREALAQQRADLEEEMIRFGGTAEELDEILEAFQTQAAEQAEALWGKITEAIDQIKRILTLKQGELLVEGFPALLGEGVSATPRGRLGLRDRVLPFGDQDVQQESGVRERLSERLQERLADNSACSDTTSGRVYHGRMGHSGFAMQPGRPGGVFSRQTVGRQAQLLHGRMAEWGWGAIEQLVEILELKMTIAE